MQQDFECVQHKELLSEQVDKFILIGQCAVYTSIKTSHILHKYV